MQNKELNIIDLIEKNPISKLSSTYNGKLLNKIKENFTGFEQQLFVSSFFCYLNYDKNIDFVIDLDDIWRWLGFKQKINAKMLLEKYFKIDIDYKNLSSIDSTMLSSKKIFSDNYCNKTAFPEGKTVLEKNDKQILVNSNDILDNKNIHDKDCDKTAFVATKAVLSYDEIQILDNKNINDKYVEKLAFVATKASVLEEKEYNIINQELIDEKNIYNNYCEETALVATKAVVKNGGQNKQTIMLNIKCFKSLCLKAQTKKASEIHEYYIKMEEILQEIVEEETDELKIQLAQKDNIIFENKELIQNTKKDKQQAIEKAIIVQFPVNTECIYIGTIDNTNEAGEKLIKFGHTNNLTNRVCDHHNSYDNFSLVMAFRVQNKVEIENLIKTYPKIKRQIRNIEVNGKNKTEIIAYDSNNFTIEKLIRYIEDIIHSKTYSIDNFNKLMARNDELENETRDLKEYIKNNIKTLEETILSKTLEINDMKEIIEQQNKKLEVFNADNQSVYQNILLPEDELTAKFKEFIEKECFVRPDVEVPSVDMEGQYRLWSRTKPSKEVYHALKNYLDTRFKPARIKNQTKDQVVHGYIGVKLKEIEYKKSAVPSDVETFLFQVCRFSPSGKILYSTLLSEYHKWKKSVSIEIKEDDLKEIKEYLNASKYALKSTVWTDYGNNEGYYGLSLKCDENKHKKTSSTGKKVEKREINNNQMLGTWETIAKAAQYEGISPSRMSTGIKNKTVYNNDYYYCAI